MPPTFLIFMGFIVYFGLLGVAFLIGGPMLLSKNWRIKGKIIILTAIISYPTLLIVGLTLTLIFALPGLGLMFLFEYLDLIPLIGISLLIFLLIVAVSALYHWYLGHIMIRNYLNKRPIDQQIENDKVYSIFLKRVINYYGINRTLKNKIIQWKI
ncbi:MAG: hypothetical protein FVQ77_08205 [Cytophagales bacterium]|nr:hypothetical protein [Cytophagales bacterium]